MAEVPAVIVSNKKPFRNYLTSVLIVLNENPRVAIRARGGAIPRAIDVVNVIREKFLPTVDIEAINIGSETLPRREGSGVVGVPYIEIILVKPSAHATVAVQAQVAEEMF